MHSNYKRYNNKSNSFQEETKLVLEEQAWQQWVDNPTTLIFLSLLKQERERLVKDVSYSATKRGISDVDVRIIAAQIKTTDDIMTCLLKSGTEKRHYIPNR